MPEENVTREAFAHCDPLCEPCKRKKGLPNTIHQGEIMDYTSRPTGGWRARRLPGDADSRRPTFGVELETDAPTFHAHDIPGRPNIEYLPMDASPERVAEYTQQRRDSLEWQQRNVAAHRRQQRAWDAAGHINAWESVSLMAPRGLWWPKYDGSVSGPEFASQPATLAYWRSPAVRAQITGMYKALLHGGLRSHDGDHCGLHVNIGTTGFDTKDHLYRFATLVTLNPRWSTRMSQRTNSSVSHWSPFNPMTDANWRSEWANQVFRHGYASQNRYCVLNASNEGRIEFRLPRGTLRIDRFYAKLEWTASMVEYARDPESVIQISAYMKWARQSGEYPALTEYMLERFPRRFDGDGSDPIAPSPTVEALPSVGDNVLVDANGYRIPQVVDPRTWSFGLPTSYTDPSVRARVTISGDAVTDVEFIEDEPTVDYDPDDDDFDPYPEPDYPEPDPDYDEDDDGDAADAPFNEDGARLCYQPYRAVNGLWANCTLTRGHIALHASLTGIQATLANLPIPSISLRTVAMCRDLNGLYECTRPAGHDGAHQQNSPSGPRWARNAELPAESE